MKDCYSLIPEREAELTKKSGAKAAKPQQLSGEQPNARDLSFVKLPKKPKGSNKTGKGR